MTAAANSVGLELCPVCWKLAHVYRNDLPGQPGGTVTCPFCGEEITPRPVTSEHVIDGPGWYCPECYGLLPPDDRDYRNNDRLRVMFSHPSPILDGQSCEGSHQPPERGQ
jgi:hypothetical protein